MLACGRCTNRKQKWNLEKKRNANEWKISNLRTYTHINSNSDDRRKSLLQMIDAWHKFQIVAFSGFMPYMFFSHKAHERQQTERERREREKTNNLRMANSRTLSFFRCKFIRNELLFLRNRFGISDKYWIEFENAVKSNDLEQYFDLICQWKRHTYSAQACANRKRELITQLHADVHKNRIYIGKLEVLCEPNIKSRTTTTASNGKKFHKNTCDFFSYTIQRWQYRFILEWTIDVWIKYLLGRSLANASFGQLRINEAQCNIYGIIMFIVSDQNKRKISP